MAAKQELATKPTYRNGNRTTTVPNFNPVREQFEPVYMHLLKLARNRIS